MRSTHHIRLSRAHQHRTEISVNYPTKHNLQIKYDSHLLYTTTCFGCLDQPSSANVGYTKRNIKGAGPLFTVL